jgi:hypothetical protein
MANQQSINDLNFIAVSGKKFRAEVDGNGNYIYIGFSSAGTTVDTAEWQIQKLAYDSTTGVVDSSDFANGSSDFDKVWSMRSMYTYDI